MKSLVLATGNPDKLSEMKLLLASLEVKLIPQAELFKEEAVEDGLTYLENALTKARFASQKTGLPALADDSGLEVEALGGEPGIYSARYALDEVSNVSTKSEVEAASRAKVLKALGNRPFSERKARYLSYAVFIRTYDDPAPLVAMADWKGEILLEERTAQSTGYDSIMWIPEQVRAVSEMSFEQTMHLGSRGKALKQLLPYIKQRLASF